MDQLHFPQSATPLLALTLSNHDPSWESLSLPTFGQANSFRFKGVQLVRQESLPGALPGLSDYAENPASAGADICQIHRRATKGECHFLHIKQWRVRCDIKPGPLKDCLLKRIKTSK